MPRAGKKQGRILVLLDILRHLSDEDHPLSVPELLEEMERRGVQMERKSVYTALATLQEQGYDVELNRGKGYYLGEREFQLPELKLLVDAVQASKFITVHKSRQLIEKLTRQASDYQASSLQRQVYVAGKARSVNERVYYTIDSIYEAIRGDRQIRFLYFDYNLERQKVYRRDAAGYVVSPFALIRSDDNYYLVACDAECRKLRHYRVDKMDKLKVLEEPRKGHALFAAQDPGSYVDRRFGMFQGEEEEVVLRCKNELLRVLIDRFGDDAVLIADQEGSFRAVVKVVVSPQFFGWLVGLEGGVEVLEPEHVRHQLKKTLSLMLRRIRAVEKEDKP